MPAMMTAPRSYNNSSRLVKRFLFQILVQALFNAQLFLAEPVLSKDAIAKSSIGSEIITRFSEEQCKKLGFLPEQLSCETCDLLKMNDDDEVKLMEQFYKECKVCCQPWRLNSRSDPEMMGKLTYQRIILKISGEHQEDSMMDGIPPHIAAQLGMMKGSGKSALQELVESKEFADLVNEKGGDRVLTVETTTSPMRGDDVMLLFLEGNPGVDEDEADEIIHLKRWDKDNVRDLIKYGLKSQKK